ncbi:MAG: pyridoxal-phosphate-dependent aminotransferase family protein [Oceanococcus sp.]
MFQAPQRYLMGPGPGPVSQRVLDASAQPTIGHLDPAFIELMNDVQGQLRQVFRTENAFSMPFSAPATGAMEACLINVLEPGDRVLVCQNGVFGVRLAEMARRCGAEVDVLEFPWGRAVDPQQLADKLAASTAFKLVCWVQAETSTGVLSDSQALAEVVHPTGALTLVDCVTAIGGCPIEVDAWGLDMVYAGSQKCLSAPPGIAPITIGERAMDALRKRKTPVQSWFMDFNLLGGYWAGAGKRAYHHTAPVNAIYGLHESLSIVLEEGLENAWARHRQVNAALVSGLAVLGIAPIPPLAERLPPLTTVGIPEGIDDAKFRSYLLSAHNLEIGAGLGAFAGNAWRIGLMGSGCTLEAVERCVAAIAAGMQQLGHEVDAEAALAAARAA